MNDIRTIAREVTSWDREELTSLMAIPDAHIATFAAQTGAIQLYRQYYHPDIPTVEIACRYGQLAILKFLRTQKSSIGIFLDKKLITEAVEHGDLDTVRWLDSIGCPRSNSVCDAAVRGGSLEVLRWLRRDSTATPLPLKYPWNYQRCLRLSRLYGCKRIENWLVELPENQRA